LLCGERRGKRRGLRVEECEMGGQVGIGREGGREEKCQHNKKLYLVQT
jgi:hypothetical protein